MTTTRIVFVATFLFSSFLLFAPQASALNQFFLSGYGNSTNNVSAFEWSGSSLALNWTNSTAGLNTVSPGMTAGDIDGDGSDEILLVRGTSSTAQNVEIWKYDSVSQGYYLVWRGAPASTALGSIGGVGDLDNDTHPEFIKTTGTAQQIWGDDNQDGVWTLEATVTPSGCSGTNPVRFVRAAGDMDGDGVPEFLAECAGVSSAATKKAKPVTSSVVQVREWDGSAYAIRASWIIASSTYYMDDSDCNGDIDGDGKTDCIFCGNDDKKSHVISYRNGGWQMVFNSSASPNYVASCKMGDYDGDGLAEYHDYGQTSTTNINVTLRFFKYISGTVQPWFNLSNLPATAHKVSSTMSGDVNNDGIDEFGLTTSAASYDIYSVGANNTCSVIASLSPLSYQMVTGRVVNLT